MDTSRASFVMNEFRTETVVDTAVKAKSRNAQALIINTQLDQTTAAALAATYLAETKDPAITMSMTLNALTHLDDYQDAPPAYAITSAWNGTNGLSTKVVTTKTDWLAGTTSTQVRS